jgi:hypothetical protein
MPIPAVPAGPGAASAVAALLRQVHQQLRDELDGLDDQGLNWVPASGANSVATIITHLVGSEAETLRAIAGVECDRDRDAEFTGTWLTMREVLAQLDGADDLIVELEPSIEPRRLVELLPLPTLPREVRRPGLTWLVGNYGHAREHVGHVQLTKQLYHAGGHTLREAARTRPSASAAIPTIG